MSGFIWTRGLNAVNPYRMYRGVNVDGPDAGAVVADVEKSSINELPECGAGFVRDSDKRTKLGIYGRFWRR